MAKIRKAVFRSGIVMMSLLAAIVLSSSVAQAQECVAYQNEPTTARAEGMTEMMGEISLQCREEVGFGVAPLPTNTTISIQLNTQITNETNEAGATVMGLEYTSGNPGFNVDDTTWKGDKKEVLSGSDTIEWTITRTDLAIPDGMTGASVVIGGILADASALGDGEDVTAVVKVNGVTINFSPVKLADVMTGLDITVTAASGLQCVVADGGATPSSAEVATIKFVEGFNTALAAVDGDEAAMARNSSLVVNLSGIPGDEVTVTASLTGTGTPLTAAEFPANDGTDLAPVMLRADSGADEDGVVTISEDGMGRIYYDVVTGTHDPDGAGTRFETEVATFSDGVKEWNTVTLTFEWETGDDAPPVSDGSVTVSYSPVGGDKIPRYAAGPTNTVLTVNDCVTSLVFPFVTNIYGYDTGIAITNTSEEAGACMLSFAGTEAPADDMEVMVMAESVHTFGVSGMASGFQGYIEATCAFRNGKGFAFISNGFESMGGPTAAQGYLVADDTIATTD